MTHTRIMSAIGGVVLLGLAGLTNAMAFTLPGIPENRFPQFENTARVEVEPFTSPSGDGSLLTAVERGDRSCFAWTIPGRNIALEMPISRPAQYLTTPVRCRAGS